MFKWVKDEDCDIGLSLFFGLVTFVKYKDTTLIYWFKSYDLAPKYFKPQQP